MGPLKHRHLLLNGGQAGTLLLSLHGEGSNGSTPVDSSVYARTPSGTTGIVQSTAAKFGSSGMKFDSLNKSLLYSDDGTWDFSNNDFTIRGWVKFRSNTADFQSIVARQKSAAGGTDYSFYLRGSNTGLDASVFIGTTSHGTGSVGSLSVGTWQFLALCRQGSTLRMYIGGTQVSFSSALGSGSVNNPSSTGVKLGMRGFDSSHPLDADLDDWQIIKGACLYPNGTAFTPPTAPLDDW